MDDINKIELKNLREISDLRQIDGSTFKINRYIPTRHLSLNSSLNTVDDLLKLFPNEKKYRRLLFNLINENFLIYYLGQLLNASLLIKEGVNKDVVFNTVQTSIEQDLKEIKSNAVERTSLEYLYFSEARVSRPFIGLLKMKYPDQRICELIINCYYSNFEEKEILRATKTLKKYNIDLKVVLPKQPENMDEIHDALFNHVEYEETKNQIKDYSLEQREDFLKMDGMKILVNGEDHFVHIPKTRLELLTYSKYNLFDNCIGKDEYYAKGCVDKKWSIIGVFDSKKKPKYCIQTAKYSFLQATGVSNNPIPKEIFTQLANQLTVLPEVPSDFIPIRHSFLFGYKYNPEKKSIFVMFTPKPHEMNPKIYEYEGVTEEVYENFAKEPKKGVLLNSVLKKYPFHRVS